MVRKSKEINEEERRIVGIVLRLFRKAKSFKLLLLLLLVLNVSAWSTAMTLMQRVSSSAKFLGRASKFNLALDNNTFGQQSCGL